MTSLEGVDQQGLPHMLQRPLAALLDGEQAREQAASDRASDWHALNALQQGMLDEYDATVLTARRLAWADTTDFMAGTPSATATAGRHWKFNYPETTLGWTFDDPELHEVNGTVVRIRIQLGATCFTGALSTPMETLFSAATGGQQRPRHIRAAIGALGLALPASIRRMPTSADIRHAITEPFLAAAASLTANCSAQPAGNKKWERIQSATLMHNELARPGTIEWPARVTFSGHDNNDPLTEENVANFMRAIIKRRNQSRRGQKSFEDPSLEEVSVFLRGCLDTAEGANKVTGMLALARKAMAVGAS